MPSFFSQNISYLRREKNLKHKQMAQILGIWEESLKQYEVGRDEPDLTTLIKIAQQLNVSLDKLLCQDMNEQRKNLRQKKIKFILFDIDGTLTDGGMYHTESGDQMRKFNVKDGMAIARVIKKHQIEVAFISSGSTINIIKNRAEKLGVSRVFAGKGSKVKIVNGWLGELGFNWKQIAYAGDDLNDLEVIKKAGFSACPSDAARQIRNEADHILSKKGGEGCIRELLEDVLNYEL